MPSTLLFALSCASTATLPESSAAEVLRPSAEEPAYASTILHFAEATEGANTADSHKKHDHGRLAYVCPMHPEVQSDKPGKCPKCGMKLIKREDKHEKN